MRPALDPRSKVKTRGASCSDIGLSAALELRTLEVVLCSQGEAICQGPSGTVSTNVANETVSGSQPSKQSWAGGSGAVLLDTPIAHVRSLSQKRPRSERAAMVRRAGAGAMP